MTTHDGDDIIHSGKEYAAMLEKACIIPENNMLTGGRLPQGINSIDGPNKSIFMNLVAQLPNPPALKATFDINAAQPLASAPIPETTPGTTV